MNPLNRVVLGTLPLCRCSHADAFRLLDAFVVAGGTAVDTAGLYGDGYAEELLGSWLRRVGPVVSVTTKAGYLGVTSDFRDPARFRATVEESVERLGLVPQAVLLHEADWSCWWNPRGMVGDLGAPPRAAAVPAWAELTELSRSFGFAVGISGNNAEVLARTATVLDVTHVLVAKQYDLIWRNAECLLSDAARRVSLGAPFHQGRLFDLTKLARSAARQRDTHLASAILDVREILASYAVTPADVALPFVLAEGRAATVCVGVTDDAELAAMVTAARRALEPELLGVLRAVGVHRPPSPGPYSQAGPHRRRAEITRTKGARWRTTRI